MGERRASGIEIGVALEGLMRVTTPEQEIKQLQGLQNVMITRFDNPDDIEQNWLMNSGGSDHIFTQKFSEEVLVTQEYTNTFMFYLFDRRYGWTEGGSHLTTSKTSHDAQYKASINEILDDYIKWQVL